MLDTPRIVIEIVPGANGEPRRDLVHEAYRTSCGTLVALALNGVGTEAVDRILDDVVPLYPRSIPGVRYVRMQDTPALLSALAHCELIYFHSAELAATALRVCSPDQSIVRLKTSLRERWNFAEPEVDGMPSHKAAAVKPPADGQPGRSRQAHREGAL